MRRQRLTTYDGGKNQAGVWQRIISLMPAHALYVEPFLGSGAIIRRKRPAAVNVGIDIDPEVIATYDWLRVDDRFQIFVDDALSWLEQKTFDSTALIYLDPPYLMSTRSDQRDLYRHEFATPEQHDRLLSFATLTPAKIMISGYESRLYESRLSSWQRRSWLVIKRNGKPATEVVWFNYPQPEELHDYRFIGRDFHDRTRIWRKLRRWQNKLSRLPPIERNAIICGILTSETALRSRHHPPCQQPS